MPSNLSADYTETSELKRILSDCFNALQSWNIWWYMGLQDVRNQFRRSRVGSGWVLINLALMGIGIGYVYGRLFNQDLSIFFPRLLLGIVLWTFISSTLVQGCQAFLVSEGYIKQFCYAKQLYLLRFLITILFNLMMGFVVYFGVIILGRLNVNISILGALPGLILLLFISIGHIIVMAYWGTRFRDLSPALSGLLQVVFYITPVIFTPEMLDQHGLGFIYHYNPFYYLIEIVRCPLVNGYMPDLKVYEFVFGECIVVWITALTTMVKFDSKLAYWL